ncbi:MAG: hypothetical protein K0S38_276 [Candidatus Paceibacter sp.]|jgi:hypothetical protein|nr:hypothetical protein [Candidatus Paceibacter sp.]
MRAHRYVSLAMGGIRTGTLGMLIASVLVVGITSLVHPALRVPNPQPQVKLNKALSPCDEGHVIFKHPGVYLIQIRDRSDPTKDLREFLRWNEVRLHKKNPRTERIGLRVTSTTAVNIDGSTIAFQVRVEADIWENRTTFPQFEEDPVRSLAGTNY